VRLLGKLLALLILIVTPAFVTAAEDQAQPRIVLVERNPWLAVIGSDSPTFALYADGLVIFRGNAGSGQLLSARLSSREYQNLLAQLAPESLLELRDEYSGTEVTDQPTNELYLWIGGKRKSISIYGAVRRDQGVRSETPPAFLRAFDTITTFTTQAQPWLPEQIELLLWPFDQSREVPAPWPDGWPDLSQARERGHDGLRQIFLPAGQYATLRELLGTLRETQAVQLGGRKWFVSFRLPFPREDAWMP
jgi:hypothetical protein